jgi:tetratricopeptide (TPR) repeat protein
MKKIILMMLGAALVASPAWAQSGGARVDVDKLRAAIAKSDADIANAKNAAKSATWVKRAEAFINADAAPVGGLYASMPENMLTISMGSVTPTQETLGSTTYSVYTYPHTRVYVSNGVVDFFVPTTVVDPQALDKAYEALDKAYTMDPKTAKKVGTDMATVRLKSYENGGTQYTLGNYKAASNEFRRAFKVSTHATVPAIDTLALYYAGMSGTYAASESQDPAEYTAALADFDKLLEMGYEADGDVYRLRFIDLYNLDRKPESLQSLETGISKYPGNEQLIDVMMRYYSENEGDPTSMIPLVEAAIAKNPNNSMLYQGLARVYDKLGQIDNSIATMQKAVQLAPEDFLSNYFEGLFVIKKAEAMNAELGKQTFTSSAAYQQARGGVLEVFRSAIAPLEKAHAINPQEIAAVELLKNLTFLLRDDEGMQARHDKYNEMFNTMNAPQ